VKKKTYFVAPMEIYREINEIKGPFLNACVTIGNFDGVHSGHQQLFYRVVEKARKRGGTSIAITFDPHPLQILLPVELNLFRRANRRSNLLRWQVLISY